MKNNRAKHTSIWSCLLAIAVAAVSIQITPAAFAGSKASDLSTDLNVQLSKASVTFIKANAVQLQAAVQGAVLTFGTSSGAWDAGDFAGLNDYAQRMVALVTSTSAKVTGSTAAAAMTVNVVTGAMIGLAQTATVTGSSLAASDFANLITLSATMSETAKEGLGKTVLSASLTPNTFSNADIIAGAISSTLSGPTADKDRASLAADIFKTSGVTNFAGVAWNIADHAGSALASGTIASTVVAAGLKLSPAIDVPTIAAISGTVASIYGTGTEAGAIAGSVAAAAKTITTSGTAIAIAVANNFIKSSGTLFTDIAQVGAGETASVAASAAAIDSALIGLNAIMGSDSGMIGISSSIAAIKAVAIKDINTIAGNTAAAIYTNDGADHAAGSINGLASALANSITQPGNKNGVIANLETLAVAIAGGTSNLLLNQYAPTVVTSVWATGTANGVPNTAGVLQSGTFAAAVVGKLLTGEAPQIAKQVAALYTSGIDQGSVGGLVALQVKSIANSGSAVAVAVAQNFGTDVVSIAQVGAGVVTKVPAQALAIGTGLIALNSGSDAGIIGISSSIAAIGTVKNTDINTLAQRSAVALNHRDDATNGINGLASAIAGSMAQTGIKGNGKLANLELLAEAIAGGTANTGGLNTYTPTIVTSVIASGSANGLSASLSGPACSGTFAGAVAKVLSSQAPQIATQVAQLYNSTTDSYNWLADQIIVASLVAKGGVTSQLSNVATAVLQTSFTEQAKVALAKGVDYTSGSTFVTQATDYAGISVQYALDANLSKAAVAITGSAAYCAAANTPATQIYQVAQIFGQSLAATYGMAPQLNGNVVPFLTGTVGNVTVTGVSLSGLDTPAPVQITSVIANKNVGSVATGIGTQLKALNGTGNPTVNEQFAAVGVALSNWLDPSVSAQAQEIADIVKALVTINPGGQCAIVGEVLTDLGLRLITANSNNSKITLLTSKSSVVADINKGLGITAGTPVTDPLRGNLVQLENTLFNSVDSKGKPTFIFNTASDKYLVPGVLGVNTAYGTITGSETPVFNN